MTERRQVHAFSEVRHVEAHTALKPRSGAQGVNTEAEEAIKLLSAEIMDAYGLCRPLDRSERSAKTH